MMLGAGYPVGLSRPNISRGTAFFQRMDMTSTVMIRVDTLDRFSLEHRAVGYALVAIFMDPSGYQVRYKTTVYE